MQGELRIQLVRARGLKPPKMRWAALGWEKEVTRRVTALMDLAVKQNDYLAQSFPVVHRRAARVVKMDGCST